MENFSISIVEDDPWYGEILEYHLSLNPDYHIKRFSTGKDFLAQLHKKPNIVTIDYSLPDINGADLYKRIRELNPEIPVIIISAQEDVSTAVDLLKAGVSDYIIKDDNTKDLLWNAILKIRENQSLKKEIEYLRQQLDKKYDFSNIIKGNSNALQKTFAFMEKAARTNINVSITGETGTGKELAAKAIHFNSDRKKQPFIAVNMAAIPHDLIESELFGFEKGAFTGAVNRKSGRFEEAHKGTIFLDEIAELDLNVQSKLLRVLQEREVMRIGGSEKISLDVRVIVATHKNLEEEVEKGNFREDLYYRVMGLPIEMPPLRERDSDVLLLAKFFLDGFCKSNNMKPVIILPDAKEKLLRYEYPGNVRELKAIVDLAAVMCNGTELTANDITFKSNKKLNALIDKNKTLREYNIQIIQHYLQKYNYNVLKVADMLDIGKSTIYKMVTLKELELS